MTETSHVNSPSRIVEMIARTRGGIIYDSELARRLGELLLEAHYGKAELARQQPLLVEDKGDAWRVEGSWNRDQKSEGAGAFYLSIGKVDGRVLDIGVWAIIHPHPSVRPLIEAHLRRKQEEADK